MSVRLHVALLHNLCHLEPLTKTLSVTSADQERFHLAERYSHNVFSSVACLVQTGYCAKQHTYDILMTAILYLSKSVPVPVCLSLSLSLCLSVSISLCVSFSVFVSLCLRLSVSVFISVSLCLSLCKADKANSNSLDMYEMT